MIELGYVQLHYYYYYYYYYYYIVIVLFAITYRFKCMTVQTYHTCVHECITVNLFISAMAKLLVIEEHATECICHLSLEDSLL